MFTEERLAEILNILQTQGKVRVKDLSKKFSVSDDCIRKDLKQLENAGKIQRTYGGAMLLNDHKQVHDISEREKIDISNKTIVAEKAVNLIQDRDTIFLDISTINILIAKLLVSSTKKVTVVTNMLEIINILAQSNNNITVVGTLGVLNKNLHGFTSSTTIDIIRKYVFDKAFIGSVGVDVHTNDITTFDIEDGMTKNSIIQSSKKTFLVMENKKFHTDGNFKFGSIEDVYGIITDTGPSNEILDILTQNDIELI